MFSHTICSRNYYALQNYVNLYFFKKKFLCNCGNPTFIIGFLGTSIGKKSACNTGNLDLIPGLGRSPEKGNGYPLLYSCLEKPMERVGWQGYSTWGHKKMDTTE